MCEVLADPVTYLQLSAAGYFLLFYSGYTSFVQLDCFIIDITSLECVKFQDWLTIRMTILLEWLFY